ncbi:UDP-glucuronosyltransferase 2A1-like [Mixophyes fleayi]|uniref:UDP-glucuronosyltransferase 2A1-like n=1 Tax=Mixophyes fleayi TaxID=3061075 RepID=UPI003F4E3609
MVPSTSSRVNQLLMLQILLAGFVFCGNILVWPTEGSHWLNTQIIIEELINRNHNVTVLISTGAAYINPNNKFYSENYEIYKVPYEKKDLLSTIDDFVKLWLYEKPNMNFFQFYQRLNQLVTQINMMIKENCNSVLKSPDLMAKLKSNQYNVLLSDPVTMCGELIAVTLDIPFIYTLRFTPASAAERHCGQLPSVPSFTPAFLSELTDKMSFSERQKNIVSYLVQDFIFFSLWGEWDSYYSDILEGSHWLNTQIIIEELINRNHNVTVLISTGAAYINPNNKFYSENYEIYKVPYEKKDLLSIIDDFVKLWLYEKPNMNFLQFYQRLNQLVTQINMMIKENCNSVLKSPDLMAKLKSNQYNVLLSDPVTMCGELIAVTLDIPFIYTLRFTPASAAERHCGQLPSVPSFTPAFLSELTDKMSFSERLKNIVSYLVQDFIFFSLWGEWDSYYSDILDFNIGFTTRSLKGSCHFA